MSETLKHTKRFLSTFQIIKTLKKKDLIAEESNDYARLPADPERKIILVHVDPRYLIGCSRSKNKSLNPMEVLMNYAEMCEAVREGKRATRPTWGSGEYVFSNGKILIHNTPYFGEPFNQEIQGYTYVCEQVDVNATDWLVCA